MKRLIVFVLMLGCATALLAGYTAVGQGQDHAGDIAVLSGPFHDRVFVAPSDHPAIEYATRQARDPVSELDRKIGEGTAQLKFDGSKGYLRSILDALSIPVESQMMVFSKTSVQAARINPGNPRSLFFNDSVAVGWVRGGFVELAAQDPEQGIIFYTLDQKEEDRPRLIRNDNCLSCHESYNSLGVPGMLARSVFARPDGTVMNTLGNFVMDHRSPPEQRWGGWYVTGKLGSLRHLGNAMVMGPENPESMDSLKGQFETDAYLAPYSDIAALMVFEHQAHMMNLLTRIGWETRLAVYQHRRDTAAQLRDSAKELVDYLLFIDEPPLNAKVQGSSGFDEKFAAQGPFDSKGRSLRQLDLERRLMRYPCSYMIYTEAFESLPIESKEAIYSRLWQILSGSEKDKKYSVLSPADRGAIVEILRETKKDLPNYFITVDR